MLALAAAIVAAPVLLFLTVRTSPKRVDVGSFALAPCLQQDTARTCYSAEVRNSGRQPTGVDCRLISHGGPAATFFNGAPRYASAGAAPLQPGSSITLFIQLEPTADASPALPELLCDAT